MFRNRNFVGMHHLLKDVEGGASPAYYAEYQLAPDQARSISFADYPGLLFYHVVQHEPPGQRLATVWRSRDFYVREGERLRATLQAPQVTVHGYISHSAVPPKPFWKRQSFLTVLLALTSLLGALEALRNHYEAVFEDPSLTLKWEKYRAEYIEMSEFSEHMELVNNLPIPHREVRLSASWMKDGNHIQMPGMAVTPASIPHMAVGATNQITVSGKTPPHGRYEVVFRVTALAGYLADQGSFEFTRPVTVWPAQPVGSLAFSELGDARTAILHGRLRVGPSAQKGLDCELILKPGAGIRLVEGFDFPGVHVVPTRFLHSGGSGSDDLALLRWSVLPVSERQEILFKFAVSRDGVTDWKKIARSAAVHCVYREEEPT